MASQPPSSLDARSLARRLGELASDERHLQVEFLLLLEEFDRRRAWLELGYGSLWTWCLEVLHLREGAAGRRIAAMKVLRRFPGLAEALRDGRLCLSTLSLLGPVLSEENLDDLVSRAAYRTAAEVDHLVASLRPRQAPREGIRRLPEPAGAGQEVPPEASPAPGPAEKSDEVGLTPRAEPPPLLDTPRSQPPEVRAVSEGQWSLRVTLDRACKENLETLSMLLGHKLPRGDLAAVLHEAIRCGIEKHGKRKGAVRPARQVKPRAEPPKDPHAIPASVRREVWERDGGRCAFRGPDGRRCGSRWQLELDHVRPPSRGGTFTISNLRLACRAHNLLHAEQVYGPEVIARYRKGRFTLDVDSGRERGAVREANDRA